mgnify:CR=1 FL=1
MDSGTTHLRVSADVYDGILSKMKKYDKVRVWKTVLERLSLFRFMSEALMDNGNKLF